MVTINDIARLAHVDKGAVSRTLRNHRDAQRLRPETRERILRIAAELGYQPNQLASSTRTGIVRSIALIGHFFNSTLYFSASQIISGILSESTKQGYGVKMYDSADLKKAFAEIVGNRIRYLLSFCAERPAREEQARFCRENGIQIVYLYEHAVGEYPAVNIDNLAASSMLVHHLAERGHRRIALLCVPHREELYSYVRERHEGYFRSMKELGLPVDPDLVSCSDDVEAAVARMLAYPPEKRPTAFYGISDNQVMRAQRVAVRLGFRLPEDLAMVGFGNNEASSLAVASITTVEEEFFRRGELAVKILFGDRNGLPPMSNGTYLIPPTLIVRESSGVCRESRRGAGGKGNAGKRLSQCIADRKTTAAKRRKGERDADIG